MLEAARKAARERRDAAKAQVHLQATGPPSAATVSSPTVSDKTTASSASGAGVSADAGRAPSSSTSSSFGSGNSASELQFHVGSRVRCRLPPFPPSSERERESVCV